MKVDGWLERAQFENIAATSATPTPTGRVYCDTSAPTAALLRYYDGSAWQILAKSGAVIQTKTGNYTVAGTDDTIYVSGDNWTLTLPAAASYPGKTVRIIKTDTIGGTNGISITRSGSDTLRDGTSTTLKMWTQNEAFVFQSDGVSVWRQVSHQTETGWVVATMTIGATTTPPTKGTVSTDSFRWRRVGDSMEVRYDYRQTAAGANGSGSYLFPIPLSMSIDSTKQNISTTSYVGFVGYANVAGDGILYDVLKAYNSTNLAIYTGSGNYFGSASTGLGTAGTLNFAFSGFVAIAGWEP